MPDLNKAERRIDRRMPDSGAGGLTIETGGGGQGPTIAPLPPPNTVTVVPGSPAIYRSAQTAMARCEVSWIMPPGQSVVRYDVQWDEDSGFGTPVTRPFTANQTRVMLDGLPAGTLVYFRVRAVGANGNFGAFSASTSATMPDDSTPPDAVTGATANWAGPDLYLRWINPSNPNWYDVQIDIWESAAKTTLYRTAYSRTQEFVWTFAESQADSSGALSAPDPISVYVELSARSVANVYSPAVALTPTNPAPGVGSITLDGSTGALLIRVAIPSDTDLLQWRIRVYRDLVLDESFVTTEFSRFYIPGGGSALYTADVTIYDVFGQESTPVAADTPVAIDILSNEQLRAGAIYTDDLSTDPAALKAALADGNRASGGITYPGSGAAYHWTQIERPTVDRYQPLLITATPGVSGYVALSNDGGVTWRWFAGPLASGRVLNEAPSQVDAQVAAVPLPTSEAGRWDLPALVDARLVRLYHLDGADYTIREWYADRLIEGDQIRAGSIQAISLSVQQLSAISANLGVVTAGSMTLGTPGGQRTELDEDGLRTYDSMGVLQVEATSSTDGGLEAGGGAVRLDDMGFQLIAAPYTGDANSSTIEWVPTFGDDPIAFIVGSDTGDMFIVSNENIFLRADWPLPGPVPGNMAVIIERGPDTITGGRMRVGGNMRVSGLVDVNSNDLFDLRITSDTNPVGIDGGEQLLPARVLGFLAWSHNGTPIRIPFFSAT